MLAFRKRSSSWNSLIKQADGMTQRRFPFGQFSFLRRGLAAEASRKPAAASRADRIRSVPSAYRCSTTRTSARFASPSRYCRSPRARPIWLVTRSGAVRRKCSLAARLPNSPGSRRRTAPASSSVWPTSSAVMKKNRRLSASPPFRLGDREIQAEQFGGRIAQHVQLGLQVRGQPGIGLGQSLLDTLRVIAGASSPRRPG